MQKLVTTLALIATTCLIGYFLSYYKAMDFFAIILAILAGGFFGLGVADGRRSSFMLEFVQIVFFCGLILFAMWKILWLIALGYLLHAGWCLLHYFSLLGARIRKLDAAMCLLYELVIAGFIFVVYQ